MYRSRPMQFRNPPRQTMASGRATLVWPLKPLLGQFTVEFLRETLRRLWNSRRPEPSRLRRYLHKAELVESTMSLDEFFDVAAGMPDFEWTVARLSELQRFAAEYADDEGAWRDLDLEDDADDALSELSRRIRLFLNGIQGDYGPEAAEWALQELRDMFRTKQEKLQNELPHWSSNDTDELLDCARRLRGATKPPRWYWKLIAFFRPDISPRLWLTKAQQSMIERRIVPALARGANLRTEIALADAKLEFFERLIGRPGVEGLLDELLQELRRYKDLIHQLVDSIPPESSDVKNDNELLLVEDLDSPIDPEQRIRVRDIFFKSAKQAGCTPRGFADLVQREGVIVAGVRRRPTEWLEVEPVELIKSLQKAVYRYLGLRSWNATPNTSQPQTAVDFIGSITLAHPNLRALLERRLPEVAQCSRPYATFQTIAGAAPKRHAFLFCYPTDRKLFEELLLVYANISNPTKGDDDIGQQFRLDSPYVMCLAQFGIACPAGAQVDLQRAARHTNRLLATGRISPLFDDYNELPEVRLLPYRPEDYEDVKQLFLASKKAQVLVPAGGSSNTFNLLKTEPRLRALFAPERFVPDWKPATFFQKQLKTGAFTDFVQATYPNLVGCHQTVQALRTQLDAEGVADELVAVGVLESNAHGLYRMSKAPPDNHMRVPYGLYRRVGGKIKGLSEEELIAELLRNDWLYNTVFWQVADAFDQRRVSAADVPDFLLEYLQFVE